MDAGYLATSRPYSSVAVLSTGRHVFPEWFSYRYFVRSTWVGLILDAASRAVPPR